MCNYKITCLFNYKINNKSMYAETVYGIKKLSKDYVTVKTQRKDKNLNCFILKQHNAHL